MKITLAHLFLRAVAVLMLFLGSVGLSLGAVTFTNTPSSINNTFNGTLTLSIGGFTNSAETLVVQKFLDVNGNGIIDSNDLLVQQFTVSKGQNSVIGGVTNVNVPGDLSSVSNLMVFNLPFPSVDIMQDVVGQYLFKVTGDFGALTNSLLVTNYPYGQSIAGNVVSNSTSQTLPYSAVVVFPPPRGGDHGPGTPLAATLANNLGSYKISLPAGSYLLMAFPQNYVVNYTTSPTVALGNGLALTTNLTAQPATSTISGKAVDAVNGSIGLPGIFLPAESSLGLLAPVFTDTNGNFTAKVTSGNWGFGTYDASLAVHGYAGNQNDTGAAAGSSGLTVTFTKATALFYGHVLDVSGNPLAGVRIGDYDQNYNIYQGDVLTDPKGYYVVGALGGLGNSNPSKVGHDGNSSNSYIYSSPPVDNNGGTNINSGQAVEADLVGLIATNAITGNVQFQGTNLSGVGVNVYGTIGTNAFNLNTVDTDANGNYSVNVGNGTWNVEVYDCGCSDGDSLNMVLSGLTYQDPPGQSVTITNNNGVANFNVTTNASGCSGVVIFDSSLPTAQIGYYYDTYLNGSTCNGNQIWTLNDPADFPTNLYFDTGGQIYGTPTTLGTYNFSVQLSDGSGNATNAAISLIITTNSVPLQIIFTPLPSSTNGAYYFQTLQASGGTPPYTWSVPIYSQPLPPNLMLDTSGDIFGMPATSFGLHYFDVMVTDALTNTAEIDGLSVDIINPGLAPLVITNSALPNGTVGQIYSVQLGATGGQSPYSWSVAPGSVNPPTGLSLSASGLISGSPAAGGSTAFKVQVSDEYADVADQVYTINVGSQVSRPLLGPVKWKPGQFGMFLTGQANQNYTIQGSTTLNPANWVTLFVTNNPATNAYVVKDPNATNSTRYYRAVVGP